MIVTIERKAASQPMWKHYTVSAPWPALGRIKSAGCVVTLFTWQRLITQQHAITQQLPTNQDLTSVVIKLLTSYQNSFISMAALLRKDAASL